MRGRRWRGRFLERIVERVGTSPHEPRPHERLFPYTVVDAERPDTLPPLAFKLKVSAPRPVIDATIDTDTPRPAAIPWFWKVKPTV